jgi:type III pantothenate kinase
LKNLVIDIGNSRAKAAVFQDGRLVNRWLGAGADEEALLAWVIVQQAEHLILSTVGREPSTTLEAAFRERMTYIRLDHKVPLPFENTYETPATLGKDRLAAVAGAMALYPGEHCLVVDAGTCVTFDVLSAEGVYQGGNIAPGIGMRLLSMHEQTQRLPKVAVGEVKRVLGKRTEEAMCNGAVLGVSLEVEGLARRLEKMWHPLRVVVSGGDAERIARHTEIAVFVQPDLVLVGLNKIITDYVNEVR